MPQDTTSPLKYLFLWLLFMLPVLSAVAQGEAEISGSVVDSFNVPLVSARVQLLEFPKIGDVTDVDGHYVLKAPSGQPLTVQFTYFEASKQTIHIRALKPGEKYQLNVRLSSLQSSPAVIKGQQDKGLIQKIDPKKFEPMVDFGGGFEARLKILPSVSSNNELSSQYSVRGGNYDENLVYINDIEIFRPQLVREGQQEGLSIIHSDLVKDIYFSPGGFEAQYGDKLSSVLDIRYKEPDSFALKTSFSLLGASGALEGSSRNHRFRYLVGSRYRTTAYLLSTLDVKGDYKPSFTDAQSYLGYDLSDRWTLNLFSYFGRNKYLSVPVSQSTVFGTVNSAVRLNVDFQGQQILKYLTMLNALSATFQQNRYNRYKIITSVYQNNEDENFDIIGSYKLQELETDASSDKFGDAKYTLGYGGYLNHARNSLVSTIYNSEFKGYHSNDTWLDLQWGLKYQHEHIEDKISEYKYIDSADYSVPQDNDNILNVSEYRYSRNVQDWNRYMGYVQNTFPISKYYHANLTIGTRGNYWDYNGQLLISPRAQFTFEPNSGYNRARIQAGFIDSLRTPIRVRIATGVYDQPPFYRELRGLSGQLNPEIRAQRSYQFMAGTDVSVKLWDRPFKWSSDFYYKQLEDIIPYEVDNVLIRYYGRNDARGYATGLETQLNGEFVRDNPSWVSMSVMRTEEDIKDDFYYKHQTIDGKDSVTVVYPGYIPRPNDQRVRFAAFFQDFLPGHPSYKVHLTVIYGTGLPFGPPTHERYKQTLRAPDYRRVDIGFSKMLFEKNGQSKIPRSLKYVRSIWLSAEVFNLFQINNTVSYLWVKDVGGGSWAVPGYLTSRLVNLHLEIKF